MKEKFDGDGEPMADRVEVALPDLLGFQNWNGIDVCCVGEDGDSWVALGHHDPGDTLEAFNRFARHVIGLDDVVDGLSEPDSWPPVKPLWAVLQEHCDEYGSAEHDEACYECQDIEEAGWWLNWGVTEQTPGAFPIMVLSF